jgi:hypothetical protein
MRKSNKEKDPSEYLMREYQELLREYEYVRDEGVKRLNFYLTVTSSILAGLVFLSQISSTMMTFQIAAIGASFFLLLIGLPLYRSIIYRDTNSDTLLRQISRVRQYFVSQSPSIEIYVSRSVNDEPTGYVLRNSSDLRVTLQAILAVLFSAIMGFSLNLFINDSLIAGIASVVLFVVDYLALNAYAKQQYKTAADRATKSVRFPKNKE